MPRAHNLRYENRDGRTWVRASAHILADPQTLYVLWRDTEKALLELSSVEEGTSRRMQFKDKTFLKDEPGRRIVWQSDGSAFHSAGGVIFEEGPGGRGTLVTVLQEFRIGMVERIWQVITGRNPRQEILENLRHFKARAETRENQ
jgi:uncharacterized membrane protein